MGCPPAAHRRRFTLRRLAAALFLSVLLTLGVHASLRRLDALVGRLLAAAYGAPDASLAVVLAAFGASDDDVQRTLRTVLEVSSVAALRPRVVVYAHANRTEALAQLPGVSEVVAAAKPGHAYLHFITANYYTALPDFVLFTPATAARGPGAATALRARLRAFDAAEAPHLHALAPATGCACAACVVPDLSLLHVRDTIRRGLGGGRGASHDDACAEPFKSFVNGQFVVSKAGVHRQPLSFYQDLQHLLHAPVDEALSAEARKQVVLRQSSRVPGSSQSEDGVLLRAYERLWTSYFACMPPTVSPVACLSQGGGAGTGHPGEHKISIPQNTVWLLWLSGWDTAPWLVQQVAESWRFHNPEWNIELVTAANLGDYVRIPYLERPYISAQAKSDIIRLHLLSTHGGVWADATVLCMQPLDNWLYGMLKPTGFWMYHGTGWPPPVPITHANTIYPASWFMVSTRYSYIARTWREAADEYWEARAIGADNYFWMDGLFRQLLASDATFLQQWREVPFISCEDVGQAHMFMSRVHRAASWSDVRLLKHRPPFVLKLSHHKFPRSEAHFTWRTRRSAGYVAVQIAKTRPAHNATAWFTSAKDTAIF